MISLAKKYQHEVVSTFFIRRFFSREFASIFLPSTFFRSAKSIHIAMHNRADFQKKIFVYRLVEFGVLVTSTYVLIYFRQRYKRKFEKNSEDVNNRKRDLFEKNKVLSIPFPIFFKVFFSNPSSTTVYEGGI